MMGLAKLSIEAADQEGAQAAIITAGANLDGEGMDEYKSWNRKRGLALGLFEPNEEEKAAMAEQAQNAQPAATDKVLEAQAGALAAQAQKDVKLADKAEADTALSEAKVIQTLADAEKKRHEAHSTLRQTGIAAHEAETKRLAATRPANDAAPSRPRIRMGRDL
jgi:hypothetical protein